MSGLNLPGKDRVVDLWLYGCMVVWLMVLLPNLERTCLDRAVLFCLANSLRVLSSPVDEGEQQKKIKRLKD